MTDAAFATEAKRRLRALKPLKAFGIVGFIALFFWCYFATLQHPRFPVTVMNLGVFDRWIGYHAWTVPIYCTLWIYVSLPPALIDRPDDLIRYAAAAALLAGVGLAIFVFWPMAVPPGGSDFLKSADRGGNACPSLHAGFAVFSAFRLHRLLRDIGAPPGWLAANVFWCLAILYSTLATKQHVLSDLIAGALLGALAAQFFSSSRLNPAPSPASSDARR